MLPAATSLAPTSAPTHSRRLFIGNAAEGFDPSRDFALGPWCFIGCEAIHPDLDETVFPLAFESPDDSYRAAMDVRMLANHVADDVGHELNRNFGASYSTRFWRCALLPWLIHLTQSSWAIWRYVERWVELNRDQDIHCVTSRARPRTDFRDTPDFLENGVRNPDYVNWIAGLAIDRIAPPSWRVERVLSPIGRERSETLRPKPPVQRDRVKETLRKFLPRLRVDCLAGAGPFLVPLHLWLSVLPSLRRSASTSEPSVAPPSTFPAGYLALLRDLAKSSIPRSFKSEFPALVATDRRHSPSRLNVGSFPLYQDAHHLATALAEEAGERIVPVQHGGIYGIVRVHPDVGELEYRRHAFLTWGWSEQEDESGRFYPVPSPILSRTRNAHRARDERLIFVGARITSLPWRIGPLPQPAQWLAYRRAKAAFLTALADAPRAACFYRPYLPDEADLEDGSYVQRRFPGMPILTGPLEPQLLRCRLFVLDYPGSTLNFALSANVPTVAYWDASAWPIARQAEPVIRRLVDAGILCESADAAAARVNAIWSDIPGWWQDAKVQEARRAFCDRFARTSGVWWWHWAKTLTRLHFER